MTRVEAIEAIGEILQVADILTAPMLVRNKATRIIIKLETEDERAHLLESVDMFIEEVRLKEDPDYKDYIDCIRRMYDEEKRILRTEESALLRESGKLVREGKDNRDQIRAIRDIEFEIRGLDRLYEFNCRNFNKEEWLAMKPKLGDWKEEGF